eukprot:2650974-Rhodomonas_salina.2
MSRASNTTSLRAADPIVLPMLRQQTRECLSIADFVSETDGDLVGVFACSCPLGEEGGFLGVDAGDEYQQVLLKALAARLVEAGTELLHLRIRKRWYESDAAQLSSTEMLQVITACSVSRFLVMDSSRVAAVRFRDRKQRS